MATVKKKSLADRKLPTRARSGRPETTSSKDAVENRAGDSRGASNTAGSKLARIPLQPAALQQAADCLRTLAHPHRLQMVQLLLSGEPFTVGELAVRCGISQPQASEHLRLMQRCQFLNAVRHGRAVYYEIAEPHLEKIMTCIENRFGTGCG